jgi:hypothetical protein
MKNIIIIILVWLSAFFFGYFSAPDSTAPITATEYKCVTESQIPTGYPFVKWEGVKVIVVMNDKGERIPVKVCDNEDLLEEVSQ